MKTQWTAPTKGATLAELLVLFPTNKKLPKLINRYGANCKTGLAIIDKDSGYDDPIDQARINGEVFENHCKYFS